MKVWILLYLLENVMNLRTVYNHRNDEPIVYTSQQDDRFSNEDRKEAQFDEYLVAW
jgi:hypothetical protein